ncbi:MAG: NAD-dependent epimerase/dehydratase [Geminicoccaceae bacterium]|jgi:nucleoside-diphosphate-sugar epimerase|nr:NAD-dependent epimerase/dehydratase [Geminicoccaceae bacterium]
MRILVIGGTNFIGPRVIAELHRQEHEITVYHRGVHEADLPTAVRHIHDPRAEIPISHFPSSLTDPLPDVVLHMFPIGENDTKAAIARFAGVAHRIVAISSGDVYRAYGRLLGTEPGPAEAVPLTEQAPLREELYPYRSSASAGTSDWTYHYEKILVERALLAGNLPATILRLPAVYGPDDPHSRLRPFVKRMVDGRPAILIETHNATWRWTHGYVEDVAAAIASATTNERAVGKVYNLGEAMVPTMLERVRRIGQALQWTGTVVSLDRDRLPAHLQPRFEPRQDLVMDTGAIRAELGFRESLTESEGLYRTIEWERGHPSKTGDPTIEEYRAEDAALAEYEHQRGTT